MRLAGNSGNIEHASGKDMHALAAELYPVPASLTGEGPREILKRLGRRIPLEICEVPSGARVFDWTVPQEWNVRDAYVMDSSGRKVIDFREHALHLVGYSAPFRGRMSLAELKPRLHTLPARPDWIPFRTSYYRRDWGFCLSHNRLASLADGDYDVLVDTTLEDGELRWGEFVMPGEGEGEVLVSTHICHPSMGNDNLSGVVTACFLAEALGRIKTRYTYRFLFLPGTIGSIAWLYRNRDWAAGRIRHALVLTCVGDRAPLTYKRSRRGNAAVDRVFASIVGSKQRVRDFSPWGYDERQYCSPGFNLPAGCLMRTPNGEFAQYHSSGDDLSFLCPEALEDTLAVCLRAFDILESDGVYTSTNPFCEPQLGRRGLYPPGGPDLPECQAMLWILNLSDGRHSLLEIAERSRLPFKLVFDSANVLIDNGLLVEVPDNTFFPASAKDLPEARRSTTPTVNSKEEQHR
jgi:aminopeptidase-like protein